MKAMLDARLKMINGLIKLYDKFPDRFDVVPKLTGFFTLLKTLYAMAEAKFSLCAESTRATTEMKNKVLHELAMAVNKLTYPLRSYAFDTGDFVLESDMKKATVRKLETMIEEQVEAACKAVIDKANALKVAAADYNLTEDMITAAEDKLQMWKAWFNANSLKRAAISAALEEVDKLTGEMMRKLTGAIDPLVFSISDDADLVLQYEAARGVKAPARTMTQLQLLVQERGSNGAMLPVYQAHVHILCTYMDKNKVTWTVAEDAVSDIDGHIIFKPIRYGRYDVTVTKPGFQPVQQLQMLVKRGKISRLEIELKAA